MSTPTNHWKLGLFVVVSSLIGLLAMVLVAASLLSTETVAYKSYFDEAVSGLAIGSPVTFRGVVLGNVSAIDVAPDRRHVEIAYDLGVEELSRLGLASKGDHGTQIKVPPDLRVQLGSNGITGSKYLQIDFFESATHPPPHLPFRTGRNHIPATSSTLKNVEDAVVRAADAIPQLAQEMTTILAQLSNLLQEITNERLPEKSGLAIDTAQRVLSSLDHKLAGLDVHGLSDQTQTALTHLNDVLAKADSALGEVAGDRGLMVSLTRASNGIGDLAENARDLGPEMTRALSSVEGAAQALQELLISLERDPDMLVKGRAEASP